MQKRDSIINEKLLKSVLQWYQIKSDTIVNS